MSDTLRTAIVESADLVAPTATLPFAGAALSRVTEELAKAAALWLDTADAVVLAIGFDPDATEASVLSWGRNLQPRDHAMCGAERVERLLIQSARLLTSRLTERWPAGVGPSRLGVVTDGTGVAFAPEDPWPMAAGWLDRRRRSRAGLVALQRFDVAGGWALLTLPRHRHPLH
ncbi:MAG: hypothetical protein ACTHMG_02455 [Sphingomonas sp.]